MLLLWKAQQMIHPSSHMQHLGAVYHHGNSLSNKLVSTTAHDFMDDPL
jgi:hypothetical protein